LKLAQIEAFYSVIRAGSISQAARQMHLTQPALSLQIRDLEEFFNVRLLERTNKGVKPTAAGGLVYYYGQKLMAMKEMLCSEIEKLQKGAERPLLLGASTVAGGYALHGCLNRFQEIFPEVKIRLTVMNSSQVVEMLLDGCLDVAIVEGPLPLHLLQGATEIISREVGSDELVVVTSPHMYPGKDTIGAEDLKKLPVIMREQGSGLRFATDNMLRAVRLKAEDINIVMELNSIEAIKTALVHGNRFAILSRLSVKNELDFGLLKALRVEGWSESLPFTMLYVKRSFLSAPEKSFIDFMAGGVQLTA
jgi:DNA-binding transcriptional LysR family regulator